MKITRPGMEKEDITNKFLGGFLSVEFLVALVIAAVAWGNTIANVSALDGQVQKNQAVHERDLVEARAETQALRKDIGEIKAVLGAIQVTQQYFTLSIQEQKEQTSTILEILRKEEK
jgi:hypothetical protein